MFNESSAFIKNAIFFESVTPKRKPVFVNGRNFYSLTYRHSGEISITCDGKQLISAADCITFIPKNVAYTTEVLSDVRMSAIHFELDDECPMPALPMVIPVNNPLLGALFQSLTHQNNDTSSTFLRMSIFYEILAQLNKLSLSTAEQSIPKKIAKAKQRIEKVFRDPYFSIAALAEELQISETYLRREFQAAYKTSPIKFLKETRVKAAKHLLLTQQITVSTIAQQCGYTSVSYFIQDFHKSVGESPNQYRQRLCFS